MKSWSIAAAISWRSARSTDSRSISTHSTQNALTALRNTGHLVAAHEVGNENPVGNAPPVANGLLAALPVHRGCFTFDA
jgi:hypothetical protein